MEELGAGWGPRVPLELSLGCEEHEWLWRHQSWAGFVSPHEVPSARGSWWGTGRATCRCFLAGPLGASHAIGLVFPVPSTTAPWDPPVGSQRGILLPDGWLEHVPLWPPGAPQAGVRPCCRGGSSLGVRRTAGSPRDSGRQRERHKRGVRGLTAAVPAGARGSVSTCPQSSPPTMPSSSSSCWPTSAWPPSWTRAYSREVSLAPAGKRCLLAPFLRATGDFWVPRGWRGALLALPGGIRR